MVKEHEEAGVGFVDGQDHEERKEIN